MKKYCPKCDTYYQTPEGDKEMKNCPFCSLGEFKDDNLEVNDKIAVKNVEISRNKK